MFYDSVRDDKVLRQIAIDGDDPMSLDNTHSGI